MDGIIIIGFKMHIIINNINIKTKYILVLDTKLSKILLLLVCIVPPLYIYYFTSNNQICQIYKFYLLIFRLLINLALLKRGIYKFFQFLLKGDHPKNLYIATCAGLKFFKLNRNNFLCHIILIT